MKNNNSILSNLEKGLFQFELHPIEYTVKGCLDNFEYMVYCGEPEIEVFVEEVDRKQLATASYQAGFKDGMETMYNGVIDNVKDNDIIGMVNNTREDILFQMKEWGTNE